MATSSVHPRLVGKLRAVKARHILGAGVDLVLKRNGVNLAPQRVLVQHLQAEPFEEGKVVSVPGGALELEGAVDFDVQAGDTFTHDGRIWEVVDDPTVTPTSLSKSVRAQMRSRAA